MFTLLLKFARDLLSTIFVDFIKEGTIPMVFIDGLLFIIVSVIFLLIIKRYFNRPVISYVNVCFSILLLFTYYLNYVSIMFIVEQCIELFIYYDVLIFNMVVYNIPFLILNASPLSYIYVILILTVINMIIYSIWYYKNKHDFDKVQIVNDKLKIFFKVTCVFITWYFCWYYKDEVYGYLIKMFIFFKNKIFKIIGQNHDSETIESYKQFNQMDLDLKPSERHKFYINKLKYVSNLIKNNFNYRSKQTVQEIIEESKKNQINSIRDFIDKTKGGN